MSFHRSILVALATLFTAVTASGAFAGCCGWGVTEPVVYAGGGCGGCGLSYAPTYATPMAVAPISVGCGGCGVPTVAAVYAQPVAPAVYGGCGGCGGFSNGCCGASYVYAAPAITLASPVYVVNQGPSYSGPGIMVPYRTWGPRYASYAPGPAYPYIRHRYWGSRFAYGPRPYFAHRYFGPRFGGPRWHG